MAEQHSTADLSTGELVGRLSAESTALIRDEIRLAQLEMQQKAKHAGLGIGMFGAAGLTALYGLGAAVAAAVLALALVLAAWLAALVVAVILFVVAGVVALIGKRQVSEATPVAPQESIDSVRKDMAAVKGNDS